jgi:hypothetical protein
VDFGPCNLRRQVLTCSQKLPLKPAAAQENRSLLESWLRGRDLNPRPSGYEPDELPGCSTPHFENNFDIDVVQIEKDLFDRGDVKLRNYLR